MVKSIKLITAKSKKNHKRVNSGYFTNRTHGIIICGKTQSGKSYYLLELLPHLNIDKLIIMSRSIKKEPYISIIDHYKDSKTILTLSHEFSPELWIGLDWIGSGWIPHTG